MIQDIIEVTQEQATQIIETRQQIGLFWYEKDGWFVGIDNSANAAWTEEFLSYDRMEDWLLGYEPEKEEEEESQEEPEFIDVEIFKEEALKTKKDVSEIEGKYYIKVNTENVRTCSKCGKKMIKGYCIDGGEEYYCSDECLLSEMTWEEWLELYGDGETDSYWTEWEEI